VGWRNPVVGEAFGLSCRRACIESCRLALPANHVSARRVQARAFPDLMSVSPAYPHHLLSPQGDALVIPSLGEPVSVTFGRAAKVALGGLSSWAIRSRAGVLVVNYAARLKTSMSIGAFTSGTKGMLHPVVIFELLDFPLTIGYTSCEVSNTDDARLFAQFPSVDLLVTDNRCSVSGPSSDRLIHRAFADALRREIAKFKDWPSL